MLDGINFESTYVSSDHLSPQHIYDSWNRFDFNQLFQMSIDLNLEPKPERWKGTVQERPHLKDTCINTCRCLWMKKEMKVHRSVMVMIHFSYFRDAYISMDLDVHYLCTCTWHMTCTYVYNYYFSHVWASRKSVC